MERARQACQGRVQLRIIGPELAVQHRSHGDEDGVRIAQIGIAIRHTEIVVALEFLEHLVRAHFSERHLAPADVC